MFDTGHQPRVFALPPGVDFPKAIVEGLRARTAGMEPEQIARIHLIVNTRRMARRIREIFDTGPPGLLPRLSLLTDLGEDHLLGTIPPAISSLRRRLELAQLVSRLLDAQPDLAPRASLYDLADSLAELLDEMEGEGVPPSAIDQLDVSDLSGHWERAQRFIGITRTFFDNAEEGLDAQARQRRVILSLIARWQDTPPDHPVILAGSTGSRGTTSLLMNAIAKLPQGAVVLPGFDFHMPAQVWERLDRNGTDLAIEDHPQYRFRHLLRTLELTLDQIQPWQDTSPPNEARNRAISLALRPAPVTHAWLNEGPDLPDLKAAFSQVTLVNAPSPRSEALTIALRLRAAAEDGLRAALITPDRMLSRQVTAALARWNILPDDSAGLPLQLSPPGRFLRHVADLFRYPLTADRLLTLLKHPLTRSSGDRGPHLRATRELDLFLRKIGTPFPDTTTFQKFANPRDDIPADWVEWLSTHFCGRKITGTLPLSDWTQMLFETAESIAEPGGELWKARAGLEAQRMMQELIMQAPYGGDMSAADFADLLGALLARGEVRDRDAPHPDIMIWGTLEARVQGADLVILGGLNEGTWPEAAKPDPWLNRKMRHDAGLLMPDRRIGLSAHDFQQAIAAPEVWLTRAIRSDDAQTVPSRWINRVTNMLSGLPETGGTEALDDMETRGKTWLAWAEELEQAPAIDPAPRPSPRPPIDARPRQLSVTDVERLIRDPYAIYAKHVLRLRPLDPLVRLPDPRIKGIAIHGLLDQFIKSVAQGTATLDRESFLDHAREVLDREVPWPTARLLWQGQLARSAEWFVAREEERRSVCELAASEIQAVSLIGDLGFTLTARADRIDRAQDGTLVLYDYKTGSVPTKEQQKMFNKQLLLEAAMAEAGDFKDMLPAHVSRAAYIGIGSQTEMEAPLDEEPPHDVWAQFRELIATYLRNETGFTSRRMMARDSDTGDYDQLARYGEWDETLHPVAEDLS